MILGFSHLILAIGWGYVLHLYFDRLAKIEKRIETIELNLDRFRHSYEVTVKNCIKLQECLNNHIGDCNLRKDLMN